MSVPTICGKLDCLLIRGRQNWASLRRHAVPIVVAGTEVLAASVADAWALRRVQGRRELSERGGLGLTELAVLEALDMLTSSRPRAFPSCAEVLGEVDRRIGLGCRYGFDLRLDLARPWTVPVRLVAFRGNANPVMASQRPGPPTPSAGCHALRKSHWLPSVISWLRCRSA